MEYVILAFFGLMAIFLILSLIKYILTKLQFKKGHNPFCRICKKCGAYQNMYESNVEGCDLTWWEEVYPIGNDPNCKCHSYAEHH